MLKIKILIQNQFSEIQTQDELFYCKYKKINHYKKTMNKYDSENETCYEMLHRTLIDS